jgi:hypothetical protein
MSKTNHGEAVWKAATFKDATREALRKWRALTLEQIIAALEEMQELAHTLGAADGTKGNTQPDVREGVSGYGYSGKKK